MTETIFEKNVLNVYTEFSTLSNLLTQKRQGLRPLILQPTTSWSRCRPSLYTVIALTQKFNHYLDLWPLTSLGWKPVSTYSKNLRPPHKLSVLIRTWWPLNVLHSTVLLVTHSHTHSYSASMCSTFSIKHPSHTDIRGHLGVQYLAQGHFGTWNGEDWAPTGNPLVNGRPALPPEPLLFLSAYTV